MLFSWCSFIFSNNIFMTSLVVEISELINSVVQFYLNSVLKNYKTRPYLKVLYPINIFVIFPVISGSLLVFAIGNYSSSYLQFVLFYTASPFYPNSVVALFLESSLNRLFIGSLLFYAKTSKVTDCHALAFSKI